MPKYSINHNGTSGEIELLSYEGDAKSLTVERELTGIDSFGPKMVEHAKQTSLDEYAKFQREYTRQSYAEYVQNIVKLVGTVNSTPVVLAAAWLSGTVDLNIRSISDIYKVYGLQVAAIVDAVSVFCVEGPAEKQRIEEIRKWWYCGLQDAKTIKLAQLAVNLSTMPFYNRNCTEILTSHALDLVGGPLKDGNPYLVGRLNAAVDLALEITRSEKYTTRSGLCGLRVVKNKPYSKELSPPE